MNTSDKTNDSSERGIGFQAVGFAVVGCASVAILQFGSESSSWAYQSFETAATRLYWAFVVPLAALFDWGRKMFETRKAIREAALRKAVQKAVENERKRIAASGEQLREQAVQQAVEKAVEDERRRIAASSEQLREQAIQQAVENERKRIVASWEQLRGLSPEEIADRISQVDPGSGVNAS